MTRYILLSVFGFVAFGFMFFFFQKSQSSFAQNHQKVLKLFSDAKQVEATLEKDLLKSKNFLVNSYDTLVANEAGVETICRDFRSAEYGLFEIINQELDIAIKLYCDSLAEKMAKVEEFKSKNAVLQNALLFIQKYAIEGQALRSRKEHHKMVTMTLAYALVSNAESKAALEDFVETIKEKKKQQIDPDSDTAVLHVARVYELKDDLDLLTLEIIAPTSDKLLDDIRTVYFQSFTKAESSASTYRLALFAACSVFLIFLIYNIVRLWKAAQEITNNNIGLEKRVKERTKDLIKSKEQIIRQQQVLVASAKMSSLGEMAGGVAHEINTPLAIINMKVEQLEEELGDGIIDPDNFQDALKTIKLTANRIAKIVNGLKFFARDMKSMPLESTSVQSILDETFALCRERFANHGVLLTLDKEVPSQLSVTCRSVEISQVLLNLLNNAFDAIEKQPEKWIKVSFEEAASEVLIAITDSGPGISAQVQEKMMQPFFTTKEVGKGTGLGLSISRGILDAHGGKLSYDANCTHTRFLIAIPKVQASEPKAS